jgi:hypothetical protein
MSLLFSCRDATALFTEEAETGLAGVEKVQFGLHLKICGPCRSYRAQLQTTVALLSAIPRESPKPSDVDAILRMLGEAPPASPEDDD